MEYKENNILGTSRKASELLQAVELGIEVIRDDLVTDTLVKHIILFKVEQWSQEQVLQLLGVYLLFMTSHMILLLAFF